MWKLITEDGEVLTTNRLDVLVEYANMCNISGGSIHTNEKIKIPHNLITPFGTSNKSNWGKNKNEFIQSEENHISSRPPREVVRKDLKVSVKCAQPAYSSCKEIQYAGCNVQIQFLEFRTPRQDSKMTVELEIQYD